MKNKDHLRLNKSSLATHFNGVIFNKEPGDRDMEIIYRFWVGTKRPGTWGLIGLLDFCSGLGVGRGGAGTWGQFRVIGFLGRVWGGDRGQGHGGNMGPI